MTSPLSAPFSAPLATPVQQVAILMWAADLSAPDRVVTPFMLAQTAAAMDAQVSMYFTARSVALLEKKHAQMQVGYGAQAMRLHHHLHVTVQAGVKIFACSQALAQLGLTRDDLVPQVTDLGGLIPFTAQALDPACRTLVF